jgi:hypothetical protein
MESDSLGYAATSTFLITADVLDPLEISDLLKLEPTRAWQRGNPTTVSNKHGATRLLGGRHKNSGWKLFAEQAWKSLSLEDQFEKWLHLLQPKKSELQLLSRRGYRCTLDVFVTRPENFTCAFEPASLKALGDLGVGIVLSVEVLELPG